MLGVEPNGVLWSVGFTASQTFSHLYKVLELKQHSLVVICRLTDRRDTGTGWTRGQDGHHLAVRITALEGSRQAAPMKEFFLP